MMITEHYHVLVWIDHREARVFQFDASEVERTRIRSDHARQHIHHKANARGSGHAGADKDFLQRVTAALSHAGSILVTGPASAKAELVEHIRQTQPRLAERITGVETLDHPSDGELLALGRSFFKADDRMHPQTHR
jgi:stalled ribosome rescue protein Dom34